MPKPMKDGLDVQAIRRIAAAFSAIDTNFPSRRFIEAATNGVQRLELRQRVDFLIELLAGYLPEDFEAASGLLEQIPNHWDGGENDDALRGFAAWPIIDYVGHHGLNNPQRSLAVLKRLTPLFSAEFAIRPFLQKHTDTTLCELAQWCCDPNEHVRRLVSEGTRPRLPWGRRLKLFIDDPTPVLSLLERLKDDPSEYVRRSVANNLNDIAKDHPQTVLERCADWKQNGNANRAWIVRHATRTLVKKGYPGIYSLLGLTEQPRISIKSFTLDPARLIIGDFLSLNFDVISRSHQSQNLIVDYAVHHVKANGKTNPKVFKLKQVTIGAGDKLRMTKKHSLREVTTRKYYPGRHAVEILINGKPMAQRNFILLNS